VVGDVASSVGGVIPEIFSARQRFDWGGTLWLMAGPSGTVTFLFTDIEGSTRLWQEDEASMRKALARHDRLLGDVIADHGGVVFSTMGDGVAAAFQSASAAVACAVQAQRLLHQVVWDTAGPLRVRVGLHTGEAEVRDGDYFGTAVNRAARLVAVGHGGQVICSSATAELADAQVALVDLGEHRLRDLDRPVHVFQIGDGSFPPLRSLDAFPGNLPIQLTSFVGRRDELASVANALEFSRLVTLTGAGGVGKTRLALQAGADLVTGFPDGVWLCELAAATDEESMLHVVAAAVGYTPAPGVALHRGIANFVSSRRSLIVLDNCEHLLDPAATLAEMTLERCANLVILATSREALEVRGERVIRLRSLAIPQAGTSLDHLTDFDAARLFLDRAEATGATWGLEAADGPAIAEICRRLDGIPLAIELAAARIIALSPGEIAARLDERFRLLTGGRRAAVERHHTLRAAIDWSYSLLSERDQAVFDRVGVFPASFDATAAQAVAASVGVAPWDVLDALTSLVAKSMLNADRGITGSSRYQMLESLRHYARDRLDATGVADETRRCHARHYAGSVAEISSGLRGPDEILWWPRLTADLDNFRAAATWALDSAADDDGELAMVILGELGVGSYGRTFNLLVPVEDEQAVERARRSPSRYASLVTAYAAVGAYFRGDFRRGRELAREAEQGVRMSAHPGRILSAKLTFVNPERLAIELTAALHILDEVGADMREYAGVHGAAASMAAVLGSVDLARQEAGVALEMGRHIGNPSAIGLALYALGLSSWRSDPTAAHAALEEHIQIAHATGDDQIMGRVLALLAQLQASAGNLPAALETLSAAIQSAHIHSDRPAVATCLARGAVVMATLGELETAAVLWGAVANGVYAHLTVLPTNEIPGHHEFIATLRSELGDNSYAAAAARGAGMTDEEGSAFALAAIEGRQRS
jgi:predicted ATPase/class 3 adenylate cyclase